MTRYTTPTNTFDVNVDLTEAEAVYVTYSQDDKVVFEKTGSDITVTPRQLSVTLTQEETGRLNTLYPVEIQIRAHFADGSAPASDVMKAPVKKVLKEGVI